MNPESFSQAETAADERRRFDRSRLIVDVFFDGGDLTGVASTQDISAGGLYMNTTADIPIGAQLLIRIPFGEKQIVARGEVVFSNAGRGVGIQFNDMNDETKSELTNLLKQ